MCPEPSHHRIFPITLRKEHPSCAAVQSIQSVCPKPSRKVQFLHHPAHLQANWDFRSFAADKNGSKRLTAGPVTCTPLALSRTRVRETGPSPWGEVAGRAHRYGLDVHQTPSSQGSVNVNLPASTAAPPTPDRAPWEFSFPSPPPLVLTLLRLLQTPERELPHQIPNQCSLTCISDVSKHYTTARPLQPLYYCLQAPGSWGSDCHSKLRQYLHRHHFDKTAIQPAKYKHELEPQPPVSKWKVFLASSHGINEDVTMRKRVTVTYVDHL